jgi:hypothetical protein
MDHFVTGLRSNHLAAYYGSNWMQVLATIYPYAVADLQVCCHGIPTIEPCVACILRLARLERPSLARVDSAACLTVTYDSTEETSHAGSAHKNTPFFFWRKMNTPYWKDSWSTGVIFVYCSEIDQHQYHVSASYIPTVLHAIFQLCTTSIRCSFYIKKYCVASHDTVS